MNEFTDDFAKLKKTVSKDTDSQDTGRICTHLYLVSAISLKKGPTISGGGLRALCIF